MSAVEYECMDDFSNLEARLWAIEGPESDKAAEVAAMRHVEWLNNSGFDGDGYPDEITIWVRATLSGRCWRVELEVEVSVDFFVSHSSEEQPPKRVAEAMGGEP